MALSTAISDAVLALVAFAVALPALRRPEPRRLAGVGLGLIGLAAALGTLRYGGLEAVRPLHRTASLLASGAGVPVIGVAMVLLVTGRDRGAAVWGALPALVLITFVTEYVVPVPGARTALGVVGVLGVLLAALTRIGRAPVPALAGIGGALGTALAGLVIGTEGQLGPLPAVDGFHYTLAVSTLGLGVCALRLPGGSGRTPDAAAGGR